VPVWQSHTGTLIYDKFLQLFFPPASIPFRMKYPNILYLLTIFALTVLSCRTINQKRLDSEALTHNLLIFDGLPRDYYFYTPPSYDETRPYPLILALHGGGGNALQMCKMKNAFLNLAENQGFLLVCPEGVENHWNDGRGIQNWRAHADDIDDVGFIKAMIAQLQMEYNIDPNKIFSTGISNGGKMSLRLACEASEIFAAVAIVAATMPAELPCSPSDPVSVLIMNGTEDPLVLWGGGQVQVGRLELGQILSTADTLAFWVTANHCNESPSNSWEPDTDPEDETRVQNEVYDGCMEDVSVALYTIEGGGHTWPGGAQYLPEAIIGRVSRDINAGEVIWGFFQTNAK
jgi:polyhydroxybutyrate depolymerase